MKLNLSLDRGHQKGHCMTNTPPKHVQHDGPIFIVSAPRSGTTLLQYRLRNHPRISIPTGESHFFITLYRNRDSFGDLSRLENVRAVLAAMYQQSQKFLDSDLHGLKFDLDTLSKELCAEGRHSLPAIISGLFEKNASGEGKVRWGDKTPYYVMHIPKLMKWWPNAQIIHLIRDGRDVALSLFGRIHDFGVYNTYSAAKYWQQYVERGHELGSALPPGQYFEIHYEDLLANPEETMQKLCDFLTEEYSSNLFNIESVENAGKTPLVYQPIKSENAGKWRTKMTSRQIRLFKSAAGGTLLHFNYELTTFRSPPTLFPASHLPVAQPVGS